MRKWDTVVSIYYALIVFALLVPGAVFLVGDNFFWPGLYEGVREAYKAWLLWIPIAAVLSGQTLLLFLSVDTSQKRLKPRAHILISCTVTAMLFALLTFAAISSLGVCRFSRQVRGRVSEHYSSGTGLLWNPMGALGNSLLLVFPKFL